MLSETLLGPNHTPKGFGALELAEMYTFEQTKKERCLFPLQ